MGVKSTVTTTAVLVGHCWCLTQTKALVHGAFDVPMVDTLPIQNPIWLPVWPSSPRRRELITRLLGELSDYQ